MLGEHSFCLDDGCADVIVEEPGGTTVRFYAVPTLWCVDCGMRLAWTVDIRGKILSAHGVDFDALVRTKKKLPACPGKREESSDLSGLARRESSRV